MKDRQGAVEHQARHLGCHAGRERSARDAGLLSARLACRTLRIAILVMAAAAVSLCGDTAHACAIPVFRYALERWQCDLFEVDVFYRGELTDAQRSAVTALEDLSFINGGSVNLEVVHCDVDGELDPDLQVVWDGLSDAELPLVVVRAPGGRSGSPIVWHGVLDELRQSWGDASAERELIRRLLAGDSVVWVVLGSADSAATDAVANKLADLLPTVAAEIPLPPGIGLPGSQLLSPIPLEVRFSVLTISPDDAVATWLRRTARAMSREPIDESEVVVLPVFGRGRALQVLRPDDIDEAALDELSRFLCGACSCQVKELNPGFDLLLSVNWDEQLFDPNARPIPVPTPGNDIPASQPEYVSIPQGQTTSGDAPSPSVDVPEAAVENSRKALPPGSPVSEADSSGRRPLRPITLGVAAGVLLLMGILWWRRPAM